MKIRKQMKIPKNRFAHFDWLMTIVVVCCCLWGLFIIYSATHNVTSNPWSYLKTQGTAFFIGLVAFFFIALFDYEHYESLVKYIYAANVFLLILVLIIGTGENIGSKSWIRFGGFGFQPAEIVKVGFIITFAFHLSKIKAEVNSWKNVLFMCLHGDCMDILKKDPPKLGGILHSFSGSCEMAKEVLALGMDISISGPVTYKNNRKAVEVVAEVPIEHLLIETDSPYLPPEPHRGERNSSLYVKYVAQKIAEIKNMDFDEVCRITCENAKRVFRIK